MEYRPASLFVVAHHVHKYACPGCRRAASVAPPASVNEGPPAVSLEQPEAAAPMPTETPPPPPSAAAVEPAVIVSAVKPASPIAKGLPGPGLLAHLIVSKYTDHLPLYRLERIFERCKKTPCRSTLSGWLAACAELLRPLYERMVAVVLASRALHTDDTTVKMQDTRRVHFRFPDKERFLQYVEGDCGLERWADGIEWFGMKIECCGCDHSVDPWASYED